MILLTNTSTVGTVTKASIAAAPIDNWLTLLENDAIRQHGPITIDLGGTFGVDPDDFVLPEREVLFPNALPFTESFDGEDAVTRAAAWTSGVREVIEDALRAARVLSAATPDTVTIDTIDTAPAP